MQAKNKVWVGFTLFALFTIIYFNIKGKKTNLFFAEVVDYVHKDSINRLFQAADAAKYALDYKKANAEFRNLLKQPLTTTDSLYVFNQLIYIALATNEDSAAAKCILQMETYFPNIDECDPSVLSDYFYNKGVFSYRTFRPKEALFFLQKAHKNIGQVYAANHLKNAQCLATLGLVAFEYAPSPDSAFVYLPKAYAIFQKNKDILRGWSPECLFGMSMISRVKRRYDEATGFSEEALIILDELPMVNTILAVRCLCDKARSLTMRRNKAEKKEDKQRINDEIEAYYQQAVALCPPNSIRLQECYFMWARHCGRSDMESDAHHKEHFWENYKNFEQNFKVQGVERLGFSKHLKGYWYEAHDDIDSTIFYEKQFLNQLLADSTISCLYLSESSTMLARSYERAAEKKQNPQYLDSALYIMKLVSIKYAGLDDINLPWSALFKPQFYYKTSLQVVPFSYDVKLFYKKYQSTGDLASLNNAVELAKISDALLFSRLTSQDDDAFDFFQKDGATNLYSAAIQSSAVLYKQTGDNGYLDDIFHFGERVRSFLLYRDSDARDTTVKAPRESLRDSIRQIEAAINTLKWETEKGNNDNIGLMQMQNQREALFAQLRNDYPQYYQLKTEQPIPNLKEVQKTLKPNQWLIQYTFSDTILNILYVSQKETYFHQTVWNDEMEDKLNRFGQFMSTSISPNTPEQFAHLGFELYQKLFPKLPPQYQKAFNACQELIISPDRSLNLLPFEALVESDDAFNYLNMSFLAHCFPIIYAPSWKIYSANSSSILPQQPTLKAYTYDYETNELPAAEAEMTHIKQIFNQNASFAIGKDCSIHNFYADTLQKYDILHLSLHADSDPLSKLNNKIYFGPQKSQPVFGFDLLKRPFNHKLVVLSACQSAFGMIKKGEGTYALSRILLRLGVPTVVASLWSVNDINTEKIATNFYENLIFKHNQPGKALQKAKINYLKTADSFTAHPRFWAGLVCLD